MLLTATLALAQAFGRFGYSEAPTIPGLNVDREGFVAKYGASEKFYFPQRTARWNIVSVTDAEENIDLGPGPGPSTLDVNLLAPGFMLRFPKGFSLSLRSTSAPYLSWKEGSVGEHVPTPGVRWIAVSFKTKQPPIVLGFLDDSVSLLIDGKIGAWTLRTLKPYTGWVRVALPVGTTPLATDSAATLGKLSMSVAPQDSLWWQPDPKVKGFSVVDDDTAVEATWTFDRKGAVIPAGATLAQLGRYPLSIKSPSHRLDGHTEEGPVTICDDKTLTIRFPISRIPLGRAITIGAPMVEPIGTVSAFDVSSVVALAFENLVAARDRRSRNAAEETVNSLIQDSQYVVERHTNQRLPFPASGQGMDVVAANALLYQAYTMSTQATSLNNALLTSVGWRRDWYTWRFWADDKNVERRTGALAALAGALCPEPQRRLDAAMAQAGLAAERGLGIFLQRAAGKIDEPTYLEPLWTIRNTIFDMSQIPPHFSPFARTLLGTVRIFGDTSVRCEEDAAKGILLSWTETPSIIIASGYPIVAEGDNIEARHILGYTSITATTAGDHVATLTLPPWADPLPKFVMPPLYDEITN